MSIEVSSESNSSVIPLSNSGPHLSPEILKLVEKRAFIKRGIISPSNF